MPAVERREAAELPRLLYLGDVPVEASYHGSALLHRLLEEYPPAKLLIVETEPLRSLPSRRLKGVDYKAINLGAHRLLQTRLTGFGNLWRLLSSYRLGTIRRLTDSFSPEAVLTVAHGQSCLAAMEFARKANIPLHLIVHDHWPETIQLPSFMCSWRRKTFRKMYLQAESRLCVSPFMEAEYRHDHGAQGQVLYPSRSKETGSPPVEPLTYAKCSGPLIGAYAGNITNGEYAHLIAGVAKSLETLGGRLLMYGPHSPESLKAKGLARTNISSRGLLESRNLISDLRKSADFLFVPMAFDTDSKSRNMQLSFPSKLTDYTATGLPILIWGPEHSSVVQWARRERLKAEVVTSLNIDAVANALRKLHSRERRIELGQSASQIGDQFFSYERSRVIFHKALLSQKGHTTSF